MAKIVADAGHLQASGFGEYSEVADFGVFHVAAITDVRRGAGANALRVLNLSRPPAIRENSFVTAGIRKVVGELRHLTDFAVDISEAYNMASE